MPLLRALFFLLVLVNAVLFAWGQGYFGARDEGHEPQRLADQLSPEKLKVSQAPKAAAAQPRQACRRIGGLAAAEAEKLQKSLQDGDAGLKATVTAGPDETSWWVNIGALPNKAAADKKAAELRQLGVTDFHVMQAEGGLFAISLGVFSSEAGAGEFLRTLNGKGVRSARVDLRNKAGSVTVEANGVEDALVKRLTELLAGSTATVADCK